MAKTKEDSEFLRATEAGCNSDTRNSNLDSSSRIQDEIEKSKEHWSELSEPCEEAMAEDVSRTYLGVCTDRRDREDSHEILQFLLQHNISLGNNGKTLALGQKFAEGAQGEIYAAEWINEDGKRDGSTCNRVFKVFKKKLSLQNLRRECSFQRLRIGHQGEFTCMCFGATLLPDGRFAFVFDKYWGSLHDLIEGRRTKRPNAPPFVILDAIRVMLELARGMRELHRKGIIHRDLKASNILVSVGDDVDPISDPRLLFSCNIADYESNEEILGTGFYRAPEILRHIQNSRGQARDPLLWTEKADVYSYAMTCYEILTGSMPFEGYPSSDYDMILIREERPALPDHVHPWIRALLSKCWHTDPSRRPSFHEIEDELIWTNKV